MANAIPYGMTQNMMLIAQIEAARREAGSKGYGDYVFRNDVSHMKSNEKRHGRTVCSRCGKDFIKEPGSRRTLCDLCRSDVCRENKKKYYERKKNEKIIKGSV